MTKLNTYLNFAGNTEEAFSFYRSVFGGEFTSVVRFKDFPMEGVNIPEEDQNKIMHIGLPIREDSLLMGTDTLQRTGKSWYRATTSTYPLTRKAKKKRTEYLALSPKVARLRCQLPTRCGGITTGV